MVEIDVGSQGKVKALLKKLFQFDTQDLDFGIYRIMNFKRKEIEKFIEEDLIKAAEAEFREYAKASMGDLQKEVERLSAEINRDFGEGTIDKQGRVRKHEDAPKIKEYLNKMKELESAEVTQAQIEDVFNHVYEFFSRYYDKGDFLSKRRYGGRKKYYVPYNGAEFLLHWGTRDQYYVKTGEYFKKYSFKTRGYRINFVLKEAETELNNIKAGKRYFLLSKEGIVKVDEENKELDFHFNYRKLTDDEKKKYGIRNVQKTITSHMVNRLLSEIGDKGPGIEIRRKLDGDEITVLQKRLENYVKRNTTDYFIHKNLKSFLEREHEFYLKNEVLDLDEIEDMDERNMRVNNAKIRAIKGISSKIIDFLSQIEDFQRRLFEKKKFVLRVDYCITLDLVPEEFYKEIGGNKGQVIEWKELFKLDEMTKDTLQSTVGKKGLDVEFLKSHKYLVLDTKFFSQDFKDRLLASFEALDDKIGGLLIKSENYQALNLLIPKYEGRIKSIYIDPPYNTGQDGFLYKDNYQHSSWLSMMADRLQKAHDLMKDDSVIFVNIDDNEYSHLMTLMRSIFVEHTEIPTFIWKKKGTSTNVRGAQVSSLTDYVIAFGGDESINPRVTPKQQRSYPHLDEGHYRTTIVEKKHAGLYKRDTMRFEILGQKPRPGKRWQIGIAKARELEAKNRFIIENGIVKLKIYDFEDRDTLSANPNLLLDHGSTDSASTLLTNMFGIPELYNNPKPVELVKHLISISTKPENSIVLDFFAGSGTTGHAILNLKIEDNGNRKYILVEMEEYFDYILKPRIQKLMYSRVWKDGFPVSNEGISHMFKYMYLEQYEDTLNNIFFKSLDKTVQETLHSFKDYFIRYMLDYETKDSPTRLMVDKFRTPFNYKIKASTTGEKGEFITVDLVETFNYLLGLDVERLRVFKDGDRIYKVIFGKKGNDNIVVIWRNTTDLDFEKDKKFIEEAVLNGNETNFIFINGDNYVKNARAIEPEFKKLMTGA